MTRGNTLTDRLISLWDHLGLRSAHVATQVPSELTDLASSHPDRIAGLLFCEARGINPVPSIALASRLTLLAGDVGRTGTAADAAAPQLPGCRRVTLPGYEAPIWADCVSDWSETIVAALRDLPGDASVPRLTQEQANHAGITYRIYGSGPALVLFPLFLAPSQWEAAIPALAQKYSVIVLGGQHLGGVAVLEDRATSPTYAGMVGMLLDVMAPTQGETILEVGCGSGALTRLLARKFAGANPLTGVDLNRFLVREAAALAQHDGVADGITFRDGNAERLPFDDAEFTHAYTVTVLEECDADLALRELWRVVKPGGRVGVIVRASDMIHPWNMELPGELRHKVENPPPAVGPSGVADSSLYTRMRAVGFESLTCFPMLVSFNEANPGMLQFTESGLMTRLSIEERQVWQRARKTALDAGVLFCTWPHHCVVGRKPAA